jgi:hypothetical protein
VLTQVLGAGRWAPDFARPTLVTIGAAGLSGNGSDVFVWSPSQPDVLRQQLACRQLSIRLLPCLPGQVPRDYWPPWFESVVTIVSSCSCSLSLACVATMPRQNPHLSRPDKKRNRLNLG